MVVVVAAAAGAANDDNDDNYSIDDFVKSVVLCITCKLCEQVTFNGDEETIDAGGVKKVCD